VGESVWEERGGSDIEDVNRCILFEGVVSCLEV